MTRKQVIGLAIAILWVVIVVGLALALHKLAVLGLLGLLFIMLIPFRKRG